MTSQTVIADSVETATPARTVPPLAPPRRGRVLTVVPVVTLALFLGPVAAGLLGTLAPAFHWLPAIGGAEVSLDAWRVLAARPGVAHSAWLSLWTGVAATALALAIAVLFLAACHRGRALARVRRLLSPVLAMPHAAAAIGLAFIFAPSGWIARLVSPWATGWSVPPDLATVNDPWGLALIAGLTIKELPFLLLVMLAVEDRRVRQSLDVARSLGYGPVSAWLKVALPQIYPQIRLPVYAVLAFALSVVDMALILGPTAPPTLAVQCLRWFNDPDLGLRFVAAAGALLQLLLVAGAILSWRLGEQMLAVVLRPWLAAGRRGGAGRVAGPLAWALVAAPMALAFAALAALALWSLAGRWRYPQAIPSAWSLDNWLRLLDGLAVPAWTSLAVAAAATALALALVLGCLENEARGGRRPTRRVEAVIYVPLLVPQIAFLYGVQVWFVWLDLDGGWVALVWAHLLFVLPYVFLALRDPYRGFDERLPRTAQCLGRGPVAVFWRVKLPILLRPVLAAAAIGFAVAVAQYLPTLFVGGGRHATLTTEAVTLATGGDRRAIGVYAFSQAVLPLIGFLVAVAVPALLHRHRRGVRPS